jgi:hypothetical protein
MNLSAGYFTDEFVAHQTSNRDFPGYGDGGEHSRSMSALPTACEEEGLALLGPPSPAASSQGPSGTENSAAHQLLDYDSDQSSSGDVRRSATTATTLRPDTPAAMDTDSHSTSEPGLNSMYYQCRSARIASHKEILVSVSNDDTFGKTVTVQAPVFGTFEDHASLDSTFTGSRVMKGNTTVNESLSCSFDPSTLTCLSCKKEHEILGSLPVVLVLSDQNFVSQLGSDHGKCINIVRLENATLLELFEIATEIFNCAVFPEGSIFLIGTGSHLGRSGTSVYARDWNHIVSLFTSKWRGIRVCPLTPLILSECPGTIVRELGELATWFESVYDGNPQGLRTAWSALVTATENFSTGMTSLDIMESYKVLLPSSITATALDKCVTFCSNSSRPMTFNGLSKDRCAELLGSLLNCVFTNFRACSNPEDYLARVDVSQKESEITEQKVILVGASNLRNSLPHFDGASYRIVDATVSGWIATPDNISSLCKNTAATALQATAIVFDILGNSSVRFEQFDGTTSLPFKSKGTFHLGGDVVTTSPEIFKKLVDSVTPIFKAKGDKPCVIVPPLPRYLFARCCNDAAHCTNSGKDDFSKNLLEGFMRLRNDLIKNLIQNGLTNFKVLDSCCVTDCLPTAVIPERLKGLQKVTARDGIHFSEEGYRNLAKRADKCLKTLTSTQSQP